MAVFLFLIFFCFYLSGLCGTIPSYRDSGDLIATAATLGIAHPPGYPGYIIAAHLFGRLLPWATWAYRVNMFSALCAAASVAVLYAALRCLFRPGLTEQRSEFYEIVALTAAIFYGLTPAVVTLARVAEMYSLSALIAAAILLVLFSDLPNRFSLACFLLGFGLGVHPTLIFLTPLFVLEYLSGRESKESLPLKKGGQEGFSANPPQSPFSKGGSPLLVTPMLFFLLGLSVYLFLPIRAAQAPAQNWGNPSHWRNFWRVVTRADYGGLKLHPEQSQLAWSFEDLQSQLSLFFESLKQEWTLAGVLAGAFGCIGFLRKGRPGAVRWGIPVVLLLLGPGFFVLSNLPRTEATTPAILQPYLVMVNIFWALAVAMALAELWKMPWGPSLKGGLTAALVGFMIFQYGLPPSQRHDFYTYDYGRNLMRSLPRRAVLYDPDDPTAFTLRSLQLTEGRRTDILLLNFFRTRWGYEQLLRDAPDLLPPRPMSSAQELEQQLWSYSVRVRPFYVELPQKLGPIPYHAEGLVYAADALSKKTSTEETRLRSEHLFALYPERGDFVTTVHPDFFTSHLIGYYAAAHSNLGIEYAAQGQWDQAVNQYKEALVIDPLLAAAYNNWAIVEFNHRKYADAVRLYRKAIDLSPQNEALRQNLKLAQNMLQN